MQRASGELQRVKTLNKIGTQSDSKLKDLATTFDKSMELKTYLKDNIKVKLSLLHLLFRLRLKEKEIIKYMQYYYVFLPQVYRID